jgi:hypothetical protein
MALDTFFMLKKFYDILCDLLENVTELFGVIVPFTVCVSVL